jgi:hypothetical protein
MNIKGVATQLLFSRAADPLHGFAPDAVSLEKPVLNIR